jgi:hypothetical protein
MRSSTLWRAERRRYLRHESPPRRAASWRNWSKVTASSLPYVKSLAARNHLNISAGSAPFRSIPRSREYFPPTAASNLSMIPCAILEIISLCLNLSAISCLAGNALQKTSGDNAGVFKVFTGGETSSRIFPCNKNNMGCIGLFPPSSASMAVSPRPAILFPENLLHPEFRFRTLVKFKLVIIIDKFAVPQYGHIICYSF